MKARDRTEIARALRAAAEALLMGASGRLVVYDCDETLLVSKGDITVRKATGETISMDSATFAHFKPVDGDTLDFGAFNHITKPRKIDKNFRRFKKAVERGDKVVVLTARAKGAESAIKKFLKHEGLPVDEIEVVGLQSSDPYDKARWIDDKVREGGFDQVEFYDDSHKNAGAVAEHGRRLHANISFMAANVPHPDEDDLGPVVDQNFTSDDPSEATLTYGEGEAPGGEASEWWEKQTETFQDKYCEEHPKSGYC
jgi:acid phosphatase class B